MCWRKPDDLDTALTELGEIGTVTGGSGTVGLCTDSTSRMRSRPRTRCQAMSKPMR
jgi:hypothetical protein